MPRRAACDEPIARRSFPIMVKLGWVRLRLLNSTSPRPGGMRSGESAASFFRSDEELLSCRGSENWHANDGIDEETDRVEHEKESVLSGSYAPGPGEKVAGDHLGDLKREVVPKDLLEGVLGQSKEAILWVAA